MRMDPVLGRSLTQLLEFEGDVETTFSLTFEVTEAVAVAAAVAVPTTTDSKSDNKSGGGANGSGAASGGGGGGVKYVTRELIKGGSSIAVTNDNRSRYVDLYIDARLHSGVQQQSDSFVSGFKAACDGHSLALFTPNELELLICGVMPLGAWAELEKSATYEGGYTKDTPIIKQFWSIVHNDFSPEQRLSLLYYVTGSSRMPLGGMAELKMIVQRASPDTEALPTASTCFHVLLLPEYASRDKLLSKLTTALAHGESGGFGLQ